jgi:hypothetical protein
MAVEPDMKVHESSLSPKRGSRSAVLVAAPTARLRPRHVFICGSRPKIAKIVHVFLGKHLGQVSVIRILACIDVGKRLAVGVTDFESARYRLNGPGWLEIDALVSFLVGRASGDWFPCYDYANAHHSLSTCGVGATRRSGACVRGL